MSSFQADFESAMRGKRTMSSRAFSSSVQSEFDAAVEERSLAVRDLPDGIEKLELYALYKQATKGDNDTDAPGFTDFFGRTKWDAWQELSGKSQDWAMEQYINKVKWCGAKRTSQLPTPQLFLMTKTL